MTFRYSRHGKLRFVRVGRVCLSFCVARASVKTDRAPTDPNVYFRHCNGDVVQMTRANANRVPA